MTRGKHAASASKRRETESVAADLASAEHTIASLTAQVEALKASASTRAEVHAERIRRMQAQIEAGTSIRVADLEAELTRTRDSLAGLRDEQKADRKKWSKVGDRIYRHFTGEHGMTHHEAIEALVFIWGEDGAIVYVEENNAGERQGMTPERYKTLQRVRGERRAEVAL